MIISIDKYKKTGGGGDAKPTEVLKQTITENGSQTFKPKEGYVFSSASITTDIHPTETLITTIKGNGSHSFDGEYNGAEITVDVEAPKQLSIEESYIRNLVKGKSDTSFDYVAEEYIIPKFCELIDAEIYVDYDIPKMFFNYKSDGWENLRDQNGNQLYTNRLPENFWEDIARNNYRYDITYADEIKQDFLTTALSNGYDILYGGEPLVDDILVNNEIISKELLYDETVIELDAYQFNYTYYGPNSEYTIGNGGNNSYFYIKPIYNNRNNFLAVEGMNYGDSYGIGANRINSYNPFLLERLYGNKKESKKCGVVRFRCDPEFTVFDSDLTLNSGIDYHIFGGADIYAHFVDRITGEHIENPKITLCIKRGDKFDFPSLPYANVDLTIKILNGYISDGTHFNRGIKKITYDGSVSLYDEDLYKYATELETIEYNDTAFRSNSLFKNSAIRKAIINTPKVSGNYVPQYNYLFENCYNLTEIIGIENLFALDTNALYMFGMFYNCSALTSLPLLDMTNVADCRAFTRNLNLTDLGGFKNLSISADSFFLGQCPNLTVESLMNVINNLATVSSESLNFGSTNLNKLTADQIAIATAKGWTLTA